MSIATPLHLAAAGRLQSALDYTWRDEAVMTATWEETPMGSAVPFDRTKHGDALVRHLLQQAWKEAYALSFPGATMGQAPRPVPMDTLIIAALLAARCEDYNLMSQVLPNLVPHLFLLDRVALGHELEATLKDLPPAAKTAYDKGLKPKELGALEPAIQEPVRKANALTKVANAFMKFTPPSWRVSSFGKTPALTDSANVSGLPALADPYVRMLPMMTGTEPLKTAYITWAAGASAPVRACTHPNATPGCFQVMDLPEGRDLFLSESGGGMLGQVMAARGMAYDAWMYWGSWVEANFGNDTPIPAFYVMAKLNSIRIVGPAAFMDHLEQDFASNDYPSHTPGWAWSWDKRAEQQLPETIPAVEA